MKHLNTENLDKLYTLVYEKFENLDRISAGPDNKSRFVNAQVKQTHLQFNRLIAIMCSNFDKMNLIIESLKTKNSLLEENNKKIGLTEVTKN